MKTRRCEYCLSINPPGADPSESYPIRAGFHVTYSLVLCPECYATFFQNSRPDLGEERHRDFVEGLRRWHEVDP